MVGEEVGSRRLVLDLSGGSTHRNMSLTIRHDFYQSDDRIAVSLYRKGLKSEDVGIKFETGSVTIVLPDTMERIEPLYAEIDPEQSRYTVSAVKIEVTLHKKVPGRWPALFAADVTASAPAASHPLPKPTTTPAPSTAEAKKKAKKNWDAISDDALKEPEADSSAPKDPNAGGEGELQKLFAKIYADADEDTRRAMNKSFIESKGTALSTDWTKIGKEKTEVQPPQGMQPVDF